MLKKFAQPALTRTGITVIEVLTAMVVALIGVGGVMVLIPFAVRQNEAGLDIDAATRLARNGIEMFEITGMQDPVRWTLTNLDPANPVVAAPVGGVPADTTLIAIDPLRVTSNPGGEPIGFFAGSSNPGMSPGLDAIHPGLAIPEVNVTYFDTTIGTGALSPFSSGMANRMFRTADDIQFEESDPVEGILSRPKQLYDIEPTTGVTVRRQARGEMSWMSIIQPAGFNDLVTIGQPTNMFRQYTLVFKDRILSQNPGIRQTPITQVALVGGTPQIAFSGGTLEAAAPLADLRNGDWVMLISARETVTGNGIYRKQVGFFRVNADPFTVSGTSQLISLDGSDFNFDFGDPASQPAGEDASGTWLVQLVGFSPDGERLDHVVNVYERTFRIEGASNWNR